MYLFIVCCMCFIVFYCMISQKWPKYSLLLLLQWRHGEHDSVSNHQPHDCLLNHLFRLRSKKTSKFRVTGLCAGNSPVTGEFPTQRASNAENVSIWWRHHVVRSNGPYVDWVNRHWFKHIIGVHHHLQNDKKRELGHYNHCDFKTNTPNWWPGNKFIKKY